MQRAPRQVIRLRLSSVLTIRALHAELRRLPFVFQSKDNQLNGPSFSPPPNLKRVSIDARAVVSATAEAGACLLALVDSLKRAAPSVIVEFWPSPALDAPTDDSGAAFLLRPTRVLVPIVPISGSEDASLREVARIARGLAGQAIQQLPVGYQQRVSLWMSELLEEALLNVAQHSLFSEDAAAQVATAYVAITATSPSSSTTAQRDSMSEGLDRTLQAAIVDIGPGIPRSLGVAYRQQVARTRKRPASQAEVRKELHSAVIKWALTPFGTRKTAADFANSILSESWRGLYRLQFRTESLTGHLVISSAAGRTVVGSESLAAYEEPYSMVPSAERGVPWTSVVGTVPLTTASPSSAAPRHPETHSGGAELLFAKPDCIVVPHPGYESINAESLATYVESVVFQASRRLALSDDCATRAFDLPVFSVIHPGLTLATSATADVLVAGDLDRSSTTPALLWSVLRPLMISRVCFVHFFLERDLDDTTLDTFQEYLWTRLEAAPRERIRSMFGIQGIFVQRTGRIRWFSSARRPTQSGASLTNPRIAALWRQYLRDSPEADFLEKFPVQVAPVSRTHVRSELLRSLTTRPDAALATARQLGWYWRAHRYAGSPTEGVVTRSGRVAHEYLSVHRLCVWHGGFFDSLCHELAEFLLKLSNQYSRVLVLPDSEAGSNFLLSRARPRVRDALELLHSRPRAVQFCSLREVEALAAPDSHVVVFADFRFEGTTIHSRIQSVMALTGFSSVRDISLFVCVDASTGDTLLQRVHSTNVASEFRLQHSGDRATKDLTRLSIDPVTNDLITPSQTRELALFKTLSWGQDEDSAETLLTTKSVFHFGLTFAGGRYFTIRWPVDVNLRIPQVLDALAERLVRAITQYLHVGIRSFYFLARSDSVVLSHLERICEAVVRASKGSPIGSTKHQLFISRIDYVDNSRRKITTSNLLAALDNATTLNGGPDLFGSQDMAPIAGFTGPLKTTQRLPHADRSAVDSEFAGAQPSTALFFVDNSTISGKTLNEFLAAVVALDGTLSRSIRAVCLAPIVSRLTPIEEAILSRTTLRPSEHETDRNAVEIKLLALTQLRVRSFGHVEDVPVYKYGMRLLVESHLQMDPDLVRIRELVDQNIRVIRDAASTSGATPMLSMRSLFQQGTDRRQTPRVNADAVRFRQLISLRQQGVPCTVEIIEVLQQLVGNRSGELLTMFALEPDLLSEDSLVVDLWPEVVSHALSTLGRTTDVATCANALVVASHVPGALEDAIPRIAANQGDQVQLLQVFVFLTSHGVDRSRRLRSLGPIIRRIDATPHLAPSWRTRARDLLEAVEQHDRYTWMPTDRTAARQRILEYLRDARYRHGTLGAAAWHELNRQMVDLSAFSPSSLVTVRSAFETSALKRAEEWISHGLTPVMKCCALLSQSTDLAAANSTLLRRLDPLTLRLRFKEFERVVFRFQQGRADAVEMRDAWKLVASASSGVSTDTLYGNPVAASQDATETEEIEIESRPILDLLLPQIACDPTCIVLERAHAILRLDTPVVLRSSALDRERVLLAFDLDSDTLLQEGWFRLRHMPILWGQHIRKFSELCTIIFSNIAHHGLQEGPIEISCTTEETGGAIEYVLHVANLRSPLSRPGRQQGIPNIRSGVRVLGGVMRTSEEADRASPSGGAAKPATSTTGKINEPFWIQLRLPVDRIEMNRTDHEGH